MHWAQLLFDSTPGEWMRQTLRAMPIMEAVHIVASCATFGTVLFVDLRLLGLPDTRTPVRAVLRDVLRWTWIAFAIAALTGTCMFIANATTYVGNTTFLLKMSALALAGLNMAVFELVTMRSVADWNQDAPTPSIARASAIASILLWAAIIVLGRWTGFTKGHEFTIPQGAQPQFEYPR